MPNDTAALPRTNTPGGTSSVEMMRSLQMEVHLLREELSGLREMLEGVTSALSGAQKAYAAVSQRTDLMEKRIAMMMSGARVAGK